MNKSSRAWACALLTTLFLASVSYGQGPSLEMILELPPEDTFTISPEAVIEACSKALAARDKEKPEFVAKLLMKRGMAFALKYKNSSAIEDFNDLCKLEPKNAEARCLRAGVLSALKRPEEAIADYQEALRINPKNARAHAGLAGEEWDRGNQRRALELVDKALKLDPKDLAALWMRAEMSLDTNPEASLEAANKYLEIMPKLGLDVPELYYVRGMALSAMNRPKDAVANFLVVRKLNPKSLEAAGQLSYSYAEMDKYQLALYYADECVKIDPKDPTGYGMRALNYAKCGKAKEAFEAAEKHFALAKDNKLFQCEVAQVSAAVGNYQRALEYYDKAIALKPDGLFAYTGKASLLASCDDPKFRDGAKALRVVALVYTVIPKK
jgi:tetratricopeptide (TPR) repeat protein